MAMRDVRTILAAGLMLTLAACGGSGGGSSSDSDDGDEAAVNAAISAGTNVTAGEALSFDGRGSSGDGLSYRWAFGDGGNGGGGRIAHVFTQPGTYDVTLTVVDADGERDATSVTVTVDPGPAPDATDGVLSGVVTDTSGASIADVTVEVVDGGASGTTDANGEVSLSGLGTGIDLVLRLTASGYAEQFVRTRIPAGTDAGRFEATLITREAAGTVSADTGGNVGGSDGTAIDLPPNALVDGNGDPVGGSVDVALTPVDTSNDDEFAAFPGSFGAIERDGQRVRLATLGVAEFLLEQGGDELQLAPGATAELTIPLYATQLDGNALAAGDTIPFWSLDEATGEWVREGTGTVIASSDSPTGLALTFTVSHLSWWNLDVVVDPASVVPAFSLASGDSFNDGETVFVSATSTDSNGLRQRSTANVPADNSSGSVSLDILPDTPIQVGASGRNGTVVDEQTVNGSAGETIDIDFVLAPPPEPGEVITLPYDEPGAIDPAGEVDRYTFTGDARQGIQIVIEPNGGSDLEGDLSVRAADDSIVADTPFDLGSFRAPFELIAVLPADGEYTIEVDGTANEPGGYRLRARAIDTLAVDSSVSATVAPDAEDLYLIDLATATPLTALVTSADSAFDEEAWTLESLRGSNQLDGEDRATDVVRPWANLNAEPYILRVPGDRFSAVDYDLSLARVDAPIDLTVGDRNRSTANGRIDVPGDVVLYRVPAAVANDGVFAALTQVGGDPLASGVLGVARLRDGRPYFETTNGLTESNRYRADADPADSVLANTVGRLREQASSVPADDYLIVVKAGNTTGDYALRVDRAPAGGALTADRDGSCGGDTQSVRAAIAAARPGDTVTACNGRYEENLGIFVQVDDLTISSAGGATIATSASSQESRLLTTLDPFGGGRTGLVLENITLEPGAVSQQPFFGDLVRLNGGGVTDAFGDSNTPLTVGASGAVIENATFTGMDKAISVNAAGVTIRNNTFTGGRSAIESGFGGADMTIRGNTIDAVGVNGQVISMTDGAVIENNVITAAVVDPPSDNDVPIIRLDESGNGSRGISISGNRIETDGGGLFIRLNQSNVPTVDIEANELYFTNSAGAEGLDLDGPNLTGGMTSGRVRLRNNVIDGIADADIGSLSSVFGIDIDNVDALSSFAFINNSIRAVDTGATGGDAAIVFDDLADDTFSGPLNVNFVNNLLVGAGGNGDAVFIPSGTTIDADFNYFSGFTADYEGGTTRTGGNDRAGPADLVSACTDGDDTTACRLEVQSSAGAVDAGSGSGYTDIPTTDIDGTARPINVIDIGAHEQ